MSSAGTASGVSSATVVALRYQVEASCQPREVRVAAGVDSSVAPGQRGSGELVEEHHHHRYRVADHLGLRPPRRPCDSTRSDTGETNRKLSRNSTGATASTDTTAGTKRVPAYRSAPATPIASGQQGEDERRADAELLQQLERDHRQQDRHEEQVQRPAARSRHRNSSASSASSNVGGTSVTASASSTMSKLVLPRATKNSGLSSSTANNGRARANAQSAVRCSHATSSSPACARCPSLLGQRGSLSSRRPLRRAPPPRADPTSRPRSPRRRR